MITAAIGKVRRALRWVCTCDGCGQVNPDTTSTCLRCGVGPAGFPDD